MEERASLSYPRSRRKMKREYFLNYVYLLPALIFVGAFLLYPVARTVYISFTNWDGLTSPSFVGVSNYSRLARDPIFIQSLLNTGIWVLATLLLPVGIGLLVASISSKKPGEVVFKWIFYLPYAFSLTTTGVLWSFLLNPAQIGGTFNAILEVVGLGAYTKRWLYEPPWNTYAMIAAYTWQTMGTNMILFLVGLQNIPQEPVEAAQIDGATAWQTYRYVIWPLLQPIATVVILMALINSFKVFDVIWVMTQGGPFRSSETLAVTMYRESFTMFQMGYGAAIAIVLTVFELLLAWIYLRRTFQQEL